MVVEKIGNDKLEGVKAVLSPVEIGALYTAINMRHDNRLNSEAMGMLEKFVEELIANCELKPLFSCPK